MPMKVESAEHSSPELQQEGHTPDIVADSQHRPSRAERRQASAKTARKEARKVPYLTLRDGRYYFVRRYPERLVRNGYFTEPACRISLKTSDRLEAEQLARREAYRFDRLVEAFDRECELGHAPQQRAVNPAEVLTDDVPVVARRFEALLLHSDDLDRSEKLTASELDEYVGDINTQRSQLRVANACGDYDAVAEDTRSFLEAEKLQCDEGSDAWKGLLKEMMLAQLRALRGIADRLDGDTSMPAAPAKAPAPLRSEDDLDDLDRAFAHWLTKTRPKAKTVIEAKSVWARLKSFTGKSRISALTRTEMLAFQTNEGKRLVRGKPIRPQTVNKLMGLLRAIFGLVVDDLLRERGVVSPLEKMRKEKVKTDDVTEKRLHELMHDLNSKSERAALCLSGGGIRSATFNLGLLQGLAKKNALRRFTYLSTVSGGGYIGSWLTAWLHNARGRLPPGRPDPQAEALELVLDELGKVGSGQSSEPEPIRALRSFSRYLSPERGLSGDALALVAIFLRNLFLNWLVFIPILVSGLLLPRIYVSALNVTRVEG